MLSNHYDHVHEALEWLRFVLNPESDMPAVTDWQALYAFAHKQMILGVCDPTKYDVKLGEENLIRWIGYTQKVKNKSILLNKRVSELCCMLEDAGLNYCILKGQGNAEMYPEPLLRTPGDIDVWLDADEHEVRKFVRDRFPGAVKSYKHFDFPIFNDVSVDVHVTPLRFYFPFNNSRLKHWILENKEAQFKHRTHLTGIDKAINIPTASFNAVYQLGHMLTHLFDEGVGFRHIVDLFYVLKSLDVTVEERSNIAGTLASMGMLRFARAVMWIEREVLGLSESYLLVAPDEKRGQRLLTDMLDGGNFGKYSQRYQGRQGFFRKGFVEARRVYALTGLAPCEALSCLVRKMVTAVNYAFYDRFRVAKVGR